MGPGGQRRGAGWHRKHSQECTFVQSAFDALSLSALLWFYRLDKRTTSSSFRKVQRRAACRTFS